MTGADEEELIRSVALQNVKSILLARKRAEEELLRVQEELRASRERLDAALSAADTGTFRWDLESNTLECDQNLNRLLGLPPGRSLSSFEDLLAQVLPGDRPEVAEAGRRSAREGADLDLEFRIVRPERSVHWLAAKGKASPAAAGRPSYMTGACVEITARRNAGEAARRGSERLKLALDAAQLGDWSWEADTDVVALSDRGADMFGLQHGQRITWSEMRDLLHEEHREPARKAVEHALATRTDYDIEYRLKRPSGQDCWIAARGRGTYAADGSVVGMIGVVQDVSARREAERALREGEESLRAMFEQAAVGIATGRLDGQFLESNRRFGEILGYGREELCQLSFRELTHPDDLEQTNQLFRGLLAGEIADYSIEKRYVRKDGSVVWSLTSVTLVRDESARPLRFIGVIEDITRRREAEDALRTSEQFNRTIIESSRDCIKTLALDGEILWISASGCRALHVESPGVVVGRSWLEYWQGDDSQAARRAVLAAANGGTGTFVGTLTIGGVERFWDVVITPILGASGEPTMLLAVSRDVTERMATERALREETRVLEVLNQSGSVLASQLDVRTLLQSVTDAARELSGARFAAFFYNTTDENGDAFQLFTLSGAPREAFERFGHPRATPLFAPTFRGEGIIRCDDVCADARYGKMAPHHGLPPGHLPVRSYLAVPVMARSGEVIGGLFFGHSSVGVFTERTERIMTGLAAQAGIAIDNARLYEAAQNAATERSRLLESERSARMHAEQMSAMKDEFLAVVSHELRTPLSAILGWSQILCRRSFPDDELTKALQVIERNARVQTQLIEDLLDMSRIASGKMRLDIQSVAPFGFIEAAVETLRPAAAAKEIRLEVLLDPAAGPVSGDPARLQQVVWNLLANAVKFTPKGGRVQVLLERVNSHIELSVADTGIGISADFVDHVFERFRQADSSTTRKHGGLGLGLAIVKHLVELHGGTVHVTSAGEGAGATFTVKLPLSVVHRYEGGPERIHPSAPLLTPSAFNALNLSGILVLIVDDEPDARYLIGRILAECGAEVLSAGTAEQALSFVERHRPHVLVSDIGMPGTDGFELLRRVRALGESRGGRLPAVALTAFARSEDRTRALRAGFSVHLSKPIEPSELVATIASVVGRTE